MQNVHIKMLVIIILHILVVYGNCRPSVHNEPVEQQDEYDNIEEVIANLSRIYEDPTKATHMDLLKTGILYLDKLLFLEDEVKEESPKAERLIRKLHREGAYEQLQNVPFSTLIGTYDWNSLAVGEYENIVQRSKEIWRYFLDEIDYGSFDENASPQPPVTDSNYVYE